MGHVMHSVQLVLWRVQQLLPEANWSTSVNRTSLTALVCGYIATACHSTK